MYFSPIRGHRRNSGCALARDTISAPDMSNTHSSHVDLQSVAKQTMLENGFEPEFPSAVQQQLAQLSLHPPALAPTENIRDLRDLLWSSVDNDTSRDLDQVEV